MKDPRFDSLLVAFLCYNPGAGLSVSVECCVDLGCAVVIVDDGSDRFETDDVYAEILERFSSVELITKVRNRGIAHSVNVAIAEARRRSAVLLMTVDQDTALTKRLIEALWRQATLIRHNDSSFGVLGPGFAGAVAYARNRSDGVIDVPELIQSAAVFDVEKLVEVGGADEALIIDGVDTDICLRLRAHGYRVLADAALRMEHAVGAGRALRVMNRRVLVTNHPPFRRYYMTRNRLILLWRWGYRERSWAMVYFRRFVVSTLLAIVFEPDRKQKVRSVSRGVLDAARSRRGLLVD